MGGKIVCPNCGKELDHIISKESHIIKTLWTWIGFGYEQKDEEKRYRFRGFYCPECGERLLKNRKQ